MKNHYQTLGIKRNASNDDIIKAYRKLAQKFHPDKNEGDKFFEERFKEIQEAYEVLSVPDEKGKYDSNYDYFFNGQQKNGQANKRKIVTPAIFFRKLGKILLILAGILIVLLGFLIILDEIADKRITSSEIELDELQLMTHSSSSFTLVGRLRNHSARYTLTSLDLKLTFQDCAQTGNCDTIEEESVLIFKSVPPGQVRDFHEWVTLSNDIAIRGRFQWGYTITDIRNKK